MRLSVYLADANGAQLKTAGERLAATQCYRGYEGVCVVGSHPQSAHRMPPVAAQSWVVVHTVWRPSSPGHPYGVVGEPDTAV